MGTSTTTTMASTTTKTIAATTTTTATATTMAKSPSDWLSELLANVESELDSWGGRPKLFQTLVKKINKFDERFMKLKTQGCDFSNRWVLYNLDQGNICENIEATVDSVISWGSEYTIDCEKIKRSTQNKWFKRHKTKIQK